MSFEKDLRKAVESIDIPEELLPVNIEAMLRNADRSAQKNTSADIDDIDAFVESFFAFIKENEPYYYYAYYRRSCCVHSSGRRICRCSPADRKAC